MMPNSAVGDEPPMAVLDLCAELTDRLRAGEDCRAEDFFPGGPVSDSAVDAALELIYTEFVVREEMGQQPSAAAWFARFPQWRDRLERMLQIGALFDDVDDLLPDDSLQERATVPESVAEAGEELPATRDLGPPAQARTLQQDPDPWIDQYELLERIGRGGMGVVYRARQLALNRIVALKSILPGQDAAPDQRARFRREAENMARLRHPNIVSVYAVGERDGCPFFSMEFVEGSNLAQRIAGTPQPERQAARWVEVLARAVNYAHQQGLVHRDLKPSNVVLTTDGVPKITDFGLAKFLGREPGTLIPGVVPGAEANGEPAGPTSEGVRVTATPGDDPGVSSRSDPALAGLAAGPVVAAAESATVTGMTIGTPAYMAPEQAAGNTKAVGPLTDVYALGAILYELLTGQAPFSSKASLQTLQDVQEREPPRPRTLNSRLDPYLEAVCLKCLMKKPRDRYSSAEALADDLARWLRGKPTRARPFLPWTARVRRSLRRHPAVRATIVLAALSGLIAPTVAYLRDPARRLERIERTLAQGNPVALVGESGLPAWSRWRTIAGSPTIVQAPDGVFSVQSPWAWALLEFVPDPQQEHFRFSADARQESTGTEQGQIGIYFGYSNYSTGKEARHFFASLVFNDNVIGFENAAPKKNNVRSVFHVLDEQQVSERTMWQFGDRGRSFGFTPAVFDKGRGPWHKLAVEVTPERFDYFWDDQLVNSLRRGKIIPEFETFMNDPSVPADRIPQFAPRDSLGVYVYFCQASFRRVMVEPLGDSN